LRSSWILLFERLQPLEAPLEEYLLARVAVRGNILVVLRLATRQNFFMENGGFLAFAGIFCGRIKSKGLDLPSSSLVR
jgi:hypothetical protein